MSKSTPWKAVAEMLRKSCRREQDRRIGIEIERIGMWPDGQALNYRNQTGPKGEVRYGAEVLLDTLQKNHPDWTPTKGDGGRLLGFSTPLGKVSLEPGSQLELSVDATDDLTNQVEMATQFEAEVDAITGPWGLKWIGLGVNPAGKVPDIDVIPSHRYDIMTEYLGKRARLGTSMMRLTSSLQINLDYTTEAEGMNMLRAAIAAAPVSYALFGNSPIVERKKVAVLSYRHSIWLECDPDRTGLLPEVFASNFNFEKYAELVARRPLMFAQVKDGTYVPANGLSFLDIAEGKLPGAIADENNGLNSLRELFTDARIKPGYVEVRSIDGLRPRERYAAVAFWVGLLYSAEARELAIHHCSAATSSNRETVWKAAAAHGLSAEVEDCSLRPLAQQLAEVAKRTLLKRNFGEERFLEPVWEILKTGKNPGQVSLDLYQAAKDPHAGMARLIEHNAQIR